MPRFPRPWSKKRGKRFASTALRGVAGEAVFYAALILIGVFVLSLVLINRFGLDHSQEPQTLKQVGEELGVTKERIRQIEARALNKLRVAAKKEKIEIPGL